ncbi:hypothetical protein ES703_22733 [subsurface metagenome]
MLKNQRESIRSAGGRKVFLSRLPEFAILAVLLLLFFIFGGRALKHIAIAQIAELTNTKIRTRSVDFGINGSVVIEGLEVRPDRKFEYDDTILKAQTVYARFGIGSLLLLQPQLKKISVKDFVFNAQHNLDSGEWNLTGMKIRPPKGGSGRIPLIRLKRGIVKYSKISGGDEKVVAAVPLDVKLGPAKREGADYRFEIKTAERAHSYKSRLEGTWMPGRITIAGGVSSADVLGFERVWSIYSLAADLQYDHNNDYSMELRIKDLVGEQRVSGETPAADSNEFLQKFGAFAALQRFFNRYRPDGRIDIELEAQGNLGRLSESRLTGQIYCKDVSVRNRRFPYLIEHLQGRIDFTEDSVSLNNLRGRHGDVELAINGRRSGFGSELQYQIQITSDNMRLDDDLYDALSARRKKFWSIFSPGGVAAINYSLWRQPGTKARRILAVKLLDAEATYRHFPYTLRNLTGALLFDHNSIAVSGLTSEVNDCKISIVGRVTACDTNQPMYNILVEAENVPLDSTLVEALPARQKQFCRQFKTDGLVDGEIEISTGENGLVDFTADVLFKKASLSIPVSWAQSGIERTRAAADALVVRDISGSAVFTRDLIDIKDCRGQYKKGQVLLTGRVWPGETAGQTRLQLSLGAEQTQLDKDLFGLFPMPIRKVMSELQPQGQISYTVELENTDSEDQSAYKVSVDFLGGSLNFEPFPYPVRDVTGKLIVRKGRDTIGITLQDITAVGADNVQVTPSASVIKINGQVDFADNTFSSGQFTILANDVFLDERLKAALPQEIQRFYSELSPTGRFDLEAENINVFNADDGEKYLDFAGTIRLKDCSFGGSGTIMGMDGVMTAKGLYKSSEGFCDGQAFVTAEKLKIKGKSLSRLQADIGYDHSRHSWSTKSLIADCYDGRLAGNFEMSQRDDGTLEYVLEMGFDNIDLRQFLLARAEAIENSDDSRTTTGTMDGMLSVSGQVGDSSRRIGRCTLQITDMKVAKVSPLAKLLDVLKPTEPKDFVFEQMLIDSYIKHNRLFFKQVDLSGRTVAFNGSGWMDLRDQSLDLTLTARGRRGAGAEPSVLQSLTEGLGSAIVRMEVTGNVHDPVITTRTLPVIKDTLDILGTRPAKR